MVDTTPDIDINSYLRDSTDWSHALFFVIFPDWSKQDWEKASRRVNDAMDEAGISFEGRFPMIRSGDEFRTPYTDGDRKRIAAENLIFSRYNQDGLFSLPHQKDSSIPPPPWFRDHMLKPGHYSIGQKLITVSRREAKKRSNKRKAEAQRARSAVQRTRLSDLADRWSTSEADTDNAFSAQEVPTRTPEDTVATEEDPLDSNGKVKSKLGATQAIPKPRQLKGKPRQLKDLEIHIGTIFKLDTGLLKMRRTYRDPSSWIDDSAPENFNFDKVCQSLGITGGGEKELYFFPDVTKDPHNILDGDELRGAVQLLRKQNSKTATESGISLFMTADVSHVRDLPVDMRGKKHSNQFDPHFSSC
jgi:hypothetical protein